MCKVKVLIVGDSNWNNGNIIRAIETMCQQASGGKAILSCDQAGTLSTYDIDVGNYDIVAVDDVIMSMDCGRALIGTDVPMVTFSDLNGDTGRNLKYNAKVVVSAVVTNAIARGNIRDKMVSVTRHFQTTSKMLATV